MHSDALRETTASSVGAVVSEAAQPKRDVVPDERAAVSGTSATTVVPRAVATVEVLGATRVTVAGNEVSFGRTEGRALFALLAASKDGELSESVVERLWPDEGERGLRRLETAVRDINAAMRQATGLGAGVKFVVKAAQRRRLPAAYFDVDLWRFEEAYVKANAADSESVRLHALRQMLDLYQGPLLADRDDLWCLPLRQAALTKAVTAVTQLAELERKGDPDRALGALTLAVDRIDPYSEVLWRQIMTIQGELGRLPALELTFRQLSARLAEIDAEPSVEARRTYQRFVG
ncbi:BTAD domain-containing putative transcriptional regulator [Nonomuraea sp. NPDC049480]|uniref:AfsR/SARP family transcriptional regulator n=1 Tax=Nonomuraea sp. NPDC049480 TaxID=3364353 RepID=UPI00379A7921